MSAHLITAACSTRFFRTFGLWTLAVVSLGLVACGDDDGTQAQDAGTDAAMIPDTFVADAGDDASDAGPDVSIMDAGPDVPLEPVTLYNIVDLSDEALADRAFEIIGHNTEERRCTQCHGLSVERIEEWEERTQERLGCIDSLNPNIESDAQAILDCFENEDEETDVNLMGLLSTTLHLDWFTRVFHVVYGDRADIEQTRFGIEGTMPRPPGELLTQEEVDILFTWLLRGVPETEERLRVTGGLTCTPEVRGAVADHMELMKTQSWRVINRDRGIAMFGCAEGEIGADCLSDFPKATETEYGDKWGMPDQGILRILTQYDYRSSFWTRSSVDGRYVSHGDGPPGGAGATIIDLSRNAFISADASYDPGFFPDNSGFALQGTPGGGGFCRMSLLNAEPSAINFSEPECSVFGAVGLYQHMAAVDGGDYWTNFGQFVSDNGGFSPERSLPVRFDEDARASLVPLVYEGDAYHPGDLITLPTAYQGDGVLSPSGRLLMLRARGEDGEQSGFVLRSIEATPVGDGYEIESRLVANYCERGSKVGFSLDERWVTYHRYVTEDDAVELGYADASHPEFQNYMRDGAANIYTLDLLTGRSYRITNMQPGQQALFPHYRSDGWIYFIVRDTTGPVVEYVVASDATLVNE